MGGFFGYSLVVGALPGLGSVVTAPCRRCRRVEQKINVDCPWGGNESGSPHCAGRSHTRRGGIQHPGIGRHPRVSTVSCLTILKQHPVLLSVVYWNVVHPGQLAIRAC